MTLVFMHTWIKVIMDPTSSKYLISRDSGRGQSAQICNSNLCPDSLSEKTIPQKASQERKWKDKDTFLSESRQIIPGKFGERCVTDMSAEEKDFRTSSYLQT